MKDLKTHRPLAILLAICMVLTTVGGFVFANDPVKQETEPFPILITGFEPLDAAVAEQTVAIGTPVEGLNLPNELSVHGFAPPLLGASALPVAPASEGIPTATPAAVQITISGVAWESAPVYTPEAAGSYGFTPLLPKGFTMGDGNTVPLPVITVTVDESLTAQDKLLATASLTEWAYPDTTPSNPFAGGDGSSSTPYIISTPQELANMAYLVNNDFDGSGYSAMHYKLAADIPLNGVASQKTWTPIGDPTMCGFAGSFDGQGHIVSGIYINSSGPSTSQGLFGAVYNSGVVKNVGVENSALTGGEYDSIGGIVGTNSGSIQSCFSAAVVIGGNGGMAGGIVGQNMEGNDGGGVIKNCYSTGTVTAPFESDSYAGGIAGFNQGLGSTIQDCYTTGSVSGYYAGGILGSSADDDAILKNCVALGETTTDDGSSLSGRVTSDKMGTLENLYARADMNIGKIGEEAPVTSSAKDSKDGADISLDGGAPSWDTWFTDTSAWDIPAGGKLENGAELPSLKGVDETVQATLPGGPPITISINGGDAVDGESLEAAIGATDLSTITTLTVTAGKVTLDDWYWMAGVRNSLTILTDFTVADTVKKVEDIPDNFDSGVFPVSILRIDIAKLTTLTPFSMIGTGIPGCTNLVSASFPDVVTIQDTVFMGCPALKEVSFPKATSIGISAFLGCTKLETIDFPEVLTIGDRDYDQGDASCISATFADCESLKTASFPKATYIGNMAFAGCKNLETVFFPKVTELGRQAFSVNSSKLEKLTSVDFPSVETIGESAFWQCTALTTASFPKVKLIKMQAFLRCEKLATLKLGKTPPTAIPDSDGDRFYKCPADRKLVFLDADGTTQLKDSALIKARADYDKASDPDKDNLWYGWKVKEIHTHNGITFEENELSDDGLTVGGGTLTGGNYHLTADLFLDANRANTMTIEDGDTVNLCLNGYQLKGFDYGMFTVNAGGTLNLYDCYTPETHVGAEYTHTLKNGSIDGGVLTNGGIMVDGGTFAMYGGTLTDVMDTSGNGSGVSLYGAGATFDLHDGGVTGYNAGNGYGGGIYVGANATFTLHAGSITNITTTGKGGGVCVEGQNAVFHMLGGEISGNSAVDGGGVVLLNGGTLNMTGGKISKNIASGKGGGVCVDNGTLKMGNADISGNTKKSDSAASNLYLNQNQAVTLIGKLGDDSKIGITTATLPTQSSSVLVAKKDSYSPTSEDLKKFTSDSSGYHLALSGGDILLKIGDKPLSQETVDKDFGAGNATFIEPNTIKLNRDIVTAEPIKLNASIILDLNGFDITGKRGEDNTPAPEIDGKPAIEISTKDVLLDIINTADAVGTITGGDGGNGGADHKNGGKGGDAVSGRITGIKITIGAKVALLGGKGGNGYSNGNGGDGGDGSDSLGKDTIIKPDGSATGGDGGNGGGTGTGGNGGNGTSTGTGSTEVGGDTSGGNGGTGGTTGGNGGNGGDGSTSTGGNITVKPDGETSGGNGGSGSTTGGNGGNGTSTGTGSTEVGGDTSGGSGGTGGTTGGNGGDGSTSTGGNITVKPDGETSGGSGGNGGTTGGNGGDGTSTGTGSTEVSGETSGGSGGTGGTTGGNGGDGSTSTGGNITVKPDGEASGGNGGSGTENGNGGQGGNGTSTGSGGTTTIDKDGSTSGGAGGTGSGSGNGGNGGNGTSIGGGEVNGSGTATGGDGGNIPNEGTGKPGTGGAGVTGGGAGGITSNDGKDGYKVSTNVDDTKAGTTVTVPEKELADAVVSKEDIHNGRNVKVELKVEKKNNQPDKAEVEKALETLTASNIGVYFDITLEKTVTESGSSKTETIGNSNAKITITIEIPQGMRNGSNYAVIRVHNGVAEALHTRKLGTTLSFETDKFSTYAIAFTPNKASHPLTVNLNGGNGTATDGNYKAGEIVSIDAGTKSGYSFSGWASSNGGSFANAGSASTTFTMPANAVTITANWRTNSTPNRPNSGSGYDDNKNDVFWKEIKDKINAGGSGTITADAGSYDKMPWSVMEALRQNPDISLIINWDGGNTITIPAGKAQVDEPNRIFWPLSLLTELYPNPTAGGSGQTPDKNKPGTGKPGKIDADWAATLNPQTGIDENTAPPTAHTPVTPKDAGVAQTPEQAESERERVAAGKPESASGLLTGILAALAVLGGGSLFLIWKRRKKEEQ